MKGFILAYSKSVNAGVFEGDDGKTYDFPQHEWIGLIAPQINGKVRFDGSRRDAKHVSSV